MKLIYEKSSPGRPGVQMTSIKISDSEEIPSKYLRKTPAELPEVSEAEVVRHFTALSRLNYSIDTHFYPLGSCTMKYNPKACEAAANIPELTDVHPMWPQLWGGGMLTQGTDVVPDADGGDEDDGVSPPSPPTQPEPPQ